MPLISVGDRVEVAEKGWSGVVAYVGATEFADGKWVGIVLDEPNGKNNGAVKGKTYFECEANHGIFVRPIQVKYPDSSSVSGGGKAARSSGIRAPQTRIGSNAGAAPAVFGQQANTMSRSDSSSTPKFNRTPGSSPKVTPSPSMERLHKLAGGSKTTNARSKISPSPSSERLQKAGQPLTRATKLQQPTATTRTHMPPPAVEEDAATPAKNSIAPTDEAPSVGSVSKRVADLKRMSLDQGSDGGIIKTSLFGEAGAELEYLRVETKDLAEKLETLRAKRAEDKQKLIDYERCRIQLQQLLEFKAKMQEAHGDVQRQLAEAKREAREAMEARESHHDDMSGLSETIEMATLDREVAEEKAELLQQEVDSLKERVQELEMDLEILRSEMQEPSAGDENAAIKVKQLQQQNERLREALVKMRDLSASATQENQRFSKENEELRVHLEEALKKNEKMNSEISQLEQETAELREQVDAALGSEAMIEQLTTRNLTLEEKVTELEDAIEDLEQMRVMDEEMQENSREAEKDLRQELQASHTKINELAAQIHRQLDQFKDYESTIGKFRQRTADLQEEIQDLKDQLLRVESAKTGLPADDATRLLVGAGGAAVHFFAIKVENELRRIELESSVQQANYLKAFLPDNFAKSGGDNDGLLITLLFGRLAAKAASLDKLVQEKYPAVPGGMRHEHVVKSHKAEQWGFSAKFQYFASAISLAGRRFESGAAKCSVERLSRLGHLQPEMATQERQLDNYFELLKTGRLDENTTFGPLHKLIGYLQNTYATNMAKEAYDEKKFSIGVTEQMLAGAHWMRTNLERLQFYLLKGDEAIEVELQKLFSELALFVGEIEQLTVRIRNRLNNGNSEIRSLDDEILEQFNELWLNVEKAGHVLHAVCSSASTQVSMLPDVDGLEAPRLMEMLNESAAEIAKQNEQNGPDLMRFYCGVTISTLSKLSDLFGTDGPPAEPAAGEQRFPPLLERAQARKQDAVEADSLRWQVEKKEKEISDLKMNLRLRIEEISESKLRLEMAEKRLALTGKEGDERIVRLHKRLEDMNQELKKKEREYENTMDSLQKDIVALEEENDKLKRKQKEMAKEQLLRNMNVARDTPGLSTPSQPDTPSGWPSSGGAVHDSPLLLQQIGSLQTALELSERRRAELAGEKMRAALASLRPLNVPNKPSGLHSATGLVNLDNRTNKRHDELSQLLRDANRLHKELLNFTASNTLIDISKPSRSPAVLEKQTPQYELWSRVEKAKQLKNWMSDLRAKTQRLRVAQLPAEAAPSDFAVFPTPEFTKSGGLIRCARITLPSSCKKDSGKVIPVVLRTREELRQVQLKLMN